MAGLLYQRLLTAMLDAIVKSVNILCNQHQQSVHDQGITHDDGRKRLVAALAALFSCTRLVKLASAGRGTVQLP